MPELAEVDGDAAARDEVFVFDEIESAADAGEVELEQSDVVVNMPVLTWPGGER